MTAISSQLDSQFSNFLLQQSKLESYFCSIKKKLNGIFLTSNASIIDTVLVSIPDDISILSKSFLEPSCGQGVFFLNLIIKAYAIQPSASAISKFIQENLYFVDIDLKMLETTENNISKLFFDLFQEEYKGTFNSFCEDFTKINKTNPSKISNLTNLYNKIDFVIGNPPFVTLYGRRDKKQNEKQRIYYLSNYSQFPPSLKNGKINYIMLFIERGLKFLKSKGKLSFIIDLAFFETAYQHCRKFIIENYTINSLTYNLKGFDSVASGQIILEVTNTPPTNNSILVTDAETRKTTLIEQSYWNNPKDEYKFRISYCSRSDKIVDKIFKKNDPTLKELYPQKNLRTCTMLLNMEDQFTSDIKSISVPSYPYYRGSKSLKDRYSTLKHDRYFNYDKNLQNSINEKLKEELTLKGIKNKKRIGLGEAVIYDNPKVYIRQSAKQLIASYDEKKSSANNSLYVFSLRDNTKESICFLKYLCGLLNSNLYSFFAQQRRIIRYNTGKQPQIKISDLYQIFIPLDEQLKKDIVFLVDCIYSDPLKSSKYKKQIDKFLFDYYELNNEEIEVIYSSIEFFLR
ncbi:Eco57I restriction-modification methylase domain-containing protein [Crocosphaera sp. XPORK-15E]|uniref:Eco57I restriction-modification methylase domain-containing protein n=1 Tax=Crocosphaera sp. XPORK-15E TaxID=3110247 RepID=UPI002B1F3D66|nr:TaqI-like C-terminal specificity domain-containing protein [Crocosphaera sp. XPORK-15E]MEA5534222.1 TaqI-like C-terminal specificity domain-containing protein [Crocosphaera sp. XPORK-15E]